MLLSFERPALRRQLTPRKRWVAWLGVRASSRTLKTAQLANVNGYHRWVTSVTNQIGAHRKCAPNDHRQDSKGTRWMPRHLESMKDVNGCDKPR
jgi:hypothetical protein